MFTKVNEHYFRLKGIKDVRQKTLRAFIDEAQEARQIYEDDTEGYTEEDDSETVTQFKKVIAEIEEEGWDESYNSNIVTPQDLLQILVQIDYSYSDAKLNKLKNRYLDAEEEEFRARKLRRLLLAAEREFNQIIED